jgi:hypothetical protein
MNKRLVYNLGTLILMATLCGCNFMKENSQFNDSSSTAAPAAEIEAGIGATLTGNGAASAPTAKATIGRLKNVMGVSIHSGNFKAAANQQTSNLANTTDPTQYSGADGNMLLAYAACVDSATNGTAKSKYGVNVATTVTAASNQAALVAAGITILDQYTANLASGASADVTSQLKSVLTATVQQSISNGATAKMAFITICTAANTTGSTLLGL